MTWALALPNCAVALVFPPCFSPPIGGQDFCLLGAVEHRHLDLRQFPESLMRAPLATLLLLPYPLSGASSSDMPASTCRSPARPRDSPLGTRGHQAPATWSARCS